MNAPVLWVNAPKSWEKSCLKWLERRNSRYFKAKHKGCNLDGSHIPYFLSKSCLTGADPARMRDESCYWAYAKRGTVCGEGDGLGMPSKAAHTTAIT